MTGKYWDKPWSLIDGCTPCSPGCDHCWSARMAHRSYREHLTTTEGKFNGHVRVRPDRLDIPLRRRKPTVYSIWNDLFHEAVPDRYRDQVYAMMALCKRHTFLAITKRAANMAHYWAADRVELGTRWYEARRYSKDGSTIAAKNCGTWPKTGIPNVWHGVTVCNQQEADEKIPYLLQVPGKKWLSIEPMLGPIDYLASWLVGCSDIDLRPRSEAERIAPRSRCLRSIDLVTLAGETGPGARPLHPDWVRSVRDQCDAANVLFYFKQWGEWAEIDWDNWPSRTARYVYIYPTGMVRIGRKRTGRILDGKEHNDLPWVLARPLPSVPVPLLSAGKSPNCSKKLNSECVLPAIFGIWFKEG